MTFQLAHIDPSAFQTFDLASAYNNGQKVGNAIRDTQDDNALQRYHMENPDATPEQTLAWAYQNMAPRNADDQLVRHKEMLALEDKKAQGVRQRTEDLIGVAKVLAPALRQLPQDQWNGYVKNFANSIRGHGDHHMADLLDGGGAMDYAALFNAADQAEKSAEEDRKRKDYQMKSDIDEGSSMRLEGFKSKLDQQKPPTAPSGYQWGNGGLQPIPGGPADQPKALTESQGNAAGFGTRAIDANSTIESMMAKGPNQESPEYDPTGWRARKDYAADWAGLNSARSEAGQKYDAVTRNFITAVLRKESGATISDSEIATANKMYIPQPGDAPAVLDQKKRNRELAIKALETQAGPNGIPNVPARTAVTKQGIDSRTGQPVTLILQNGQWVKQ